MPQRWMARAALPEPIAHTMLFANSNVEFLARSNATSLISSNDRGCFSGSFLCLKPLIVFYQYVYARDAGARARIDLFFFIETICACVLHNLMIESPIPDEWSELENDNELNQPIDSNTSTRRDQLLNYLLEIR